MLGSIGALIRGHWEIETRIHYVRDVTDPEDHSQVRVGNGPLTMETLRNIAISFLHRCNLRNIQRTLEHLNRTPEHVIYPVLGTSA